MASYITDPVTTTDELIPSGETSSYRSNPLGLAEFTLSRKDPEYVGAGANIVTEYATKRYRSNLINWGMLPLQLAGATPFGLGDYILIPNVREALKGDLKDIKAYVLGDAPKAFDLYMAPLTDDERQILADGCLINFYKH